VKVCTIRTLSNPWSRQLIAFNHLDPSLPHHFPGQIRPKLQPVEPTLIMGASEPVIVFWFEHTVREDIHPNKLKRLLFEVNALLLHLDQDARQKGNVRDVAVKVPESALKVTSGWPMCCTNDKENSLK
jgi:hypothetical protein